MGRTCFDCKGGNTSVLHPGESLKSASREMGFSDYIVEQMGEKDILCDRCGKKVFCRHAVDIYRYHEKKLMPDEFEDLMNSGEDWIPIAKAELGSQVQAKTLEPSQAGHAAPAVSQSKASGRITTMDDLVRLTQTRHEKTKARWNKNGIVQYKDDNIAILQRSWGAQVEFIIACSQVTSEGYRLMAIDEGKAAAAGGFTGGVNAYFYFQRTDFIR